MRLMLLMLLVVFGLPALTSTTDGPIAVGHGTAFHCYGKSYLVTNYHVVEDASDISVSRGDQSCSASLVTTDTANDLAILRVSPECAEALSLGEPLPLASTASLKQGDAVVTYGFPLPGEFADPRGRSLFL